jgi:hypothetical protein
MCLAGRSVAAHVAKTLPEGVVGAIATGETAARASAQLGLGRFNAG